jgi:hypothetical protein
MICTQNPDFTSSQSIGLILRHSIRWESARLHFNAAAAQIFVRLAVLKDKLPNLKRLEFASPVSTDVFYVAPRLHEVIVSPDGDRLYLTTEVKLPWPQITHFRGTSLSLDHALRVFGSASKMVQCRMVVFGVGHHLEARHVMLGALRRLSITTPPALFDLITTPVLQELWTPGVSPSLRDSIQRSSCQLVKLVVDECYDINLLLSILRATPTLTTLYVSGWRTEDSRVFFHALKIANGPSDLCPYLSHIAAGNTALNAMDSFLDMVESRWYTANPRLAFARVFYKSFLGQDPAPRMIQMRAEGLDIDIDVGFRALPQNYMGAGRP